MRNVKHNKQIYELASFVSNKLLYIYMCKKYRMKMRLGYT